MDAIRARRLAGWLIVAALAGITGTVSYFHALWVVVHTDTGGLVAYLVPFVPDLMIVTSSLTLINVGAAGSGQPPPGQDKPRKPGSTWEAWTSLGIGVVVTIALNVCAGLHWVPPGGSAILAALIPITFLLTFHTLLAMVRHAGSAPLSAEPARCGHKVATSLDEAVVMATAVMSQRQVAAAFGVNRNRVGQLVRAAEGLPEPSANGDGSHE